MWYLRKDFVNLFAFANLICRAETSLLRNTIKNSGLLDFALGNLNETSALVRGKVFPSLK